MPTTSTSDTAPRRAAPDMRSGPLAGVRILDMATVVAAPFACTLCADLGAEVVKLELPDGSDALRTLAPVKGRHALYWKVTNRGKRGITLDVRKAEGRALLLRLLPQFDVLVENFRTGTLERWGLDLATLQRANPQLTVLRLTGFGQTGPYAARPGFARIFEAMSGFAHLTGEADGRPQHMNYPLGDMVAGLFGAFSIAAAVADRRAHPRECGREIDLSATEAMLRMLEPLAAEFEQLGQVRCRAGSRATYTAPSNIYRTKDRCWITLVASSEPTFRRLCQAMGRPALASDPRFGSSRQRMLHIDALDGAIERWCATLACAELAQVLEQHEVPFGKVYAIDDVLADPHLQARQAIIRLPDPDLGEVPAPCAVPRFSGFAPQIPRSGPALGEHNEQVFGALGLGADELACLRSAQVI
ncbi:CaiB/BaiF CoA transferase family protein [Verminephrobacter eiseniae]|uniref:CaiB/BaiF CoA transferase family protein n=1 Tax=Verminephrobacter eiseniae TaxID=364317 RepID=UPI00223712BD|nr:CoA transferase [Verminephrobacter eiseniae]MCW5237389.1 CoA transferase [Verminephrobacter eiseniae]